MMQQNYHHNRHHPSDNLPFRGECAANKRRRIEQTQTQTPPAKEFSREDVRVLSQAAQILGVPLDVLLSWSLSPSSLSQSPTQSQIVLETPRLTLPSTSRTDIATADPVAAVEIADNNNNNNSIILPPFQINGSSSQLASTSLSTVVQGQLCDPPTSLATRDFSQGFDSSSLSDDLPNDLGEWGGTLLPTVDDIFAAAPQNSDLLFTNAFVDNLTTEFMPTMNGSAESQEHEMFQMLLSNQPAPDFWFQASEGGLGEQRGLDFMGSQSGMLNNNGHRASMARDSLIEARVQELVGPVQKVDTPPGKRAGQHAGRRGRRGAFRSEQERQQTYQTRHYGAGTRCRVQKIRCHPDVDPEKPCLTCVKRSSETISTPPCIRVKMMEAALYDKGPHPQYIWTKRWNSMTVVEIADWASHEVKTIRVTQGVADTFYELQVKRFIPIEGDSMERKWYNGGVPKAHTTAPYAIADMQVTGKKLIQFIHDNVIVTVKHNLDYKDDLLRPVYLLALDCTARAANDDERKLMTNVLHLWTAIRMESRSEYIIGEETLGMEPQLQDKNYHNYGKYLMPPVISAQIELITTGTILKPLKQKTRYVFDDFIRELHNGAKTILMYFHLCNQGVRPFSPSHVASFIKTAGLNEEQATFLKATAKVVEEKTEAEFQKIRTAKQVEDKYYFLSQLYDEGWLTSNEF